MRSLMLNPDTLALGMIIALALLFLLGAIALVRWLAPSALYIDIRRAQTIERLWKEREIYRATLERVRAGTSYAGVIEALIDAIETDLIKLGIPPESLK